MPYIATTNEQVHHIETGLADEEEREIKIDGKAQRVDWKQIAALSADAQGQVLSGGRFSLLIDGISYEIFARQVHKPDAAGMTYELQINGQRFEVYVEDEREKALTASIQSAHSAGEATLRAPMPGLVLAIPHEVGEEVTRGQTVVILEAMKMENDLGSPLAGKIKEIKVSKGQTVNQGDALIVVKGE